MNISHFKLIIATLAIFVISCAQKAASFEDGLSEAKNGRYSNALKIWTELANQDNVLAQTNLGILYENGWGVEKDYQQAYLWYKKAAAKGEMNAQHNLASLYQQGHGVEKDLNKAASWYEKAAEQDNGESQLLLGLMYIEIGEYVSATYWYQRAVNNQVEGAQKNLDYVCKLKPALLKEYC